MDIFFAYFIIFFFFQCEQILTSQARLEEDNFN